MFHPSSLACILKQKVQSRLHVSEKWETLVSVSRITAPKIGSPAMFRNTLESRFKGPWLNKTNFDWNKTDVKKLRINEKSHQQSASRSFIKSKLICNKCMLCAVNMYCTEGTSTYR